MGEPARCAPHEPFDLANLNRRDHVPRRRHRATPRTARASGGPTSRPARHPEGHRVIGDEPDSLSRWLPCSVSPGSQRWSPTTPTHRCVRRTRPPRRTSPRPSRALRQLLPFRSLQPRRLRQRRRFPTSRATSDRTPPNRPWSSRPRRSVPTADARSERSPSVSVRSGRA